MYTTLREREKERKRERKEKLMGDFYKNELSYCTMYFNWRYKQGHVSWCIHLV